MNEFELTQLVSEFEKLKDLSPEQLAITAVVYGGQITAALFAARTIVYGLGRMTGLSHPNHYHRWPRLPWRTPYKAYLALKKWYERVFLIGKRGSTGGFAGTLATLTLMHTPQKVLLGRATAFGLGLLQPIGLKIQRHLFMVAQTGSGKTELLKSIISSYEGSVSLIDVDGEVTNGLLERDPRHWNVIDPYGVTNFESASFNALDSIRESVKRDGEGAAIIWAHRISEALIIMPAGARTVYFYDVSKQFLAGLILHVYTTHPESEWHMPYVRDLIVHGYKVYDDLGNEITQDDEAHQLLIRAMLKNTSFDGAIAGAASAMESASGETGGNVRSTLQDQTKLFDIPQIRKISLKTTMSLSKLKSENDVVDVFAAPLFSLREELSRFSRLKTNLTAYTFSAEKKKKGQTLVCVDELPSQSYNPVYDVILAAGRSTGMTFLGITQNMSQMRKIDPQNYKSYIGESDAVYWMGCNHPENAALLSEILGKKTLVIKDRQTGRKSYREIPVSDPDQCRRFLDPNSGNLIVTLTGGRALRLKNEPAYKSLPVTRLERSKEHGESLLRRISRFLFDRKHKTQATPTPEQTGANVQEDCIELEVPSSPIPQDINPDNDITYH